VLLAFVDRSSLKIVCPSHPDPALSRIDVDQKIFWQRAACPNWSHEYATSFPLSHTHPVTLSFFRKEVRAESLRKRQWKMSDHLPAAACQAQKESTGSYGLCGPSGKTSPSRVHTGNTTQRTTPGGAPRSGSWQVSRDQYPSRQWTTNSSRTAPAL